MLRRQSSGFAPMPTRLKRPAFWRHVMVALGLIAFQGYLGYSVVTGQFGIESQDALETEISELEARSNALQATEACVPQIAAQSPPGFDWSSRPTEGIFQKADPSSPADSVVHYRGDAVRFVNSQKAWVRVSYECAYDVEARTVASVNVRAGQLDRPPVSTTAPNNTSAAAASPPHLSSQALARAIQQAAAQPAQIQQVPHKKPRVWEPSRVEIQQQAPNPRR